MNDVIDLTLVGLIASHNSHIQFEGNPGLAKTRFIEALARLVNGKFSRVQMTPDILPRDLTGQELRHPLQHDELVFKKGPIFANFVLVDEINRASPKTVSALLEAMSDQKVSTDFSGEFSLPSPFIVFATQNPIEQEGTYPLPEAQKDRFLLKILVDYPTENEELAIASIDSLIAEHEIRPIMEVKHITDMRNLVKKVHIEEDLKKQLVRVVRLSRSQDGGPTLVADIIHLGASPRASQALYNAVKAFAFLNDRDYVLPSDIMQIAPSILRHRLIFAERYIMDDQEKLLSRVLEEIFNEVFGEGRERPRELDA